MTDGVKVYRCQSPKTVQATESIYGDHIYLQQICCLNKIEFTIFFFDSFDYL